MVRNQLFVLAVVLLAGLSEALKGARVRHLVDSPVEATTITVASPLPKAGASKDGEAKTGVSKDGEAKGGPSVAKATVAKVAKDGCKKKSVPLKASPGSKAVKSEEDDSVPFCASKVAKKARKGDECDSLRAGKLPKGHRKIDGGVGIQFKYDESEESPSVFRPKAEKTAKKAGPKAAGCTALPEAVRLLEEKVEDVGDEDLLAISGVAFEQFQWSDDCDPTKEDCDTVVADVSVFYEGKRQATEEEAKEMLTTVVETVVSEDYGDAQVDLYWLDFNNEIIEGGNQGGTVKTAVGSAAGGLVGVAALAAASFFGVKWYRNRAQGEDGGDKVAIPSFYRS